MPGPGEDQLLPEGTVHRRALLPPRTAAPSIPDHPSSKVVTNGYAMPPSFPTAGRPFPIPLSSLPLVNYTHNPDPIMKVFKFFHVNQLNF